MPGGYIQLQVRDSSNTLRSQTFWSTDGTPAGNLTPVHDISSGKAKPVSANFTRPATTSAIAVGDLLANDVTAGSVVPLTLAVARDVGLTGLIRKLRLKTTDTAFKDASVRVHLFASAPVPTVGDNGVLTSSGTMASTESNYLGFSDITLRSAFSDAVKGFGVAAFGYEFVFQTSGNANIYALLESLTAVAVTGSANVWTLTAEVFQD